MPSSILGGASGYPGLDLQKPIRLGISSSGVANQPKRDPRARAWSESLLRAQGQQVRSAERPKSASVHCDRPLQGIAASDRTVDRERIRRRGRAP